MESFDFSQHRLQCSPPTTLRACRLAAWAQLEEVRGEMTKEPDLIIKTVYRACQLVHGASALISAQLSRLNLGL